MTHSGLRFHLFRLFSGPDGALEVEVIGNATGQATLNSKLHTRPGTNVVIEWADGSSAFANQRYNLVQLEFRLKYADLFAFQIQI